MCVVGMIKGFNVVFIVLGLYGEIDGVYIMLNVIGDVMF